ncbi:GNAT family N-acetyltransferase [Streptococcus suis]|uniref:GNAT family N-acetyltransferase n=1 Tax=Streptococcus suis TaxID=1307 RepID=UPI00211C1C69|nr:GNAT family N-acetyltransferase [Streptococcus suis]MCQ9226129.1 GNAT family N-acetyltransferase [Streptococcus suis]MCQ9228416.1 GNAT family N-acetyltransferase [Streptococcus suis]MCQ9242426.1 GNAT family N-acetyltransferase [Streptococcus suis]MCQ9274627.1 GNAT family N-acetyltransferase [Streptococcus suis]MDE7534168.1 GNAT family N-acetyltransferase [Streptococcus suis]
MIALKPVDESSYQAVLDLTVAEADKGFVAPNVRSLADAWLYRDNGDVFPYAIWADEQVVGFALIDIDEDIQQYMLWRFMIGQEFQGKGYGQAALEAVIQLAHKHPVCNHLIVSYVKGNQKMARLLEKNGFVLDLEEERELVFRLETPGVKF